MKGKLMTNEATVIDEPTVEAIAEEFVKDHNSAEIVQELVKWNHSVDSLKSHLTYERQRNTDLAQKLDIVKQFIKEHVVQDESADVEDLKELAGKCNLILTKSVNVKFTVEYNLTIECDIDEEVSTDDFRVNMDYSGVGEVTDEGEDWSDIEIEDEDYL
jgi:hypothetical protein